MRLNSKVYPKNSPGYRASDMKLSRSPLTYTRMPKQEADTYDEHRRSIAGICEC